VADIVRPKKTPGQGRESVTGRNRWKAVSGGRPHAANAWLILAVAFSDREAIAVG